MENSWQIFGHEPNKKILDRQLKSGRFAHAYLFLGPEGVGKKTLALEFAKKILETRELNTHPDFQILSEPGQISVERIRDFISSLSFKPFSGKFKVAVVDNAQNFNLQSGNALLKTLEEPSTSTILILVSSGKSLLQTIISRCQVLNFNPLSRKQLEDYAKADRLELPEGAASLSFGSIARLRTLASGKDQLLKQQDLISRYEKLKTSILADRLLAVNEMADLEPEELQRAILSWLYWQEEQLEKKPADFRLLEALSEANRQLETNKNKKLVLQGLFLKM